MTKNTMKYFHARNTKLLPNNLKLLLGPSVDTSDANLNTNHRLS